LHFICESLSLEIPPGMCQKEEKMEEFSKANETRQLPAPTFNISQLQQSFSRKGLSLKDLRKLTYSVAYHENIDSLLNHTADQKYVCVHTLGFSHCSSFQNPQDPAVNPCPRNVCPADNGLFYIWPHLTMLTISCYSRESLFLFARRHYNI